MAKSPIIAFFIKYLEYSETNHAPSSHKRFGEIIENFKYFLNYKHPNIVRIHDLRPDIFEEYKAFRRNPPDEILKRTNTPFQKKKAKTKTINMEIGTLRTIFNLAIKWQYLMSKSNKNPESRPGSFPECFVKKIKSYQSLLSLNF